MSDAMSDMSAACEGCVNWAGSYSGNPCSNCSAGFSGMQKNYYEEFKPRPGGIIKVSDANSLLVEHVKRPKHYQLCDKEAIDVIRNSLSEEQLKGYILGNVLKYRLRAGKKGGTEKTYEDIQKANEYEEMYERYFG